MKFWLAVGISALLVISGLFLVPHSFGQTQVVLSSDFTTAVQAGLQSLATNPGTQSQQQEIQNQDYKSTWDEFGTNALIDGTTPPFEVDRKITQDIIQTIQTESNYNQQETQYLENAQVTPEEIQVMEESGGSDVPPGEFIDPNPSAEANPDVSMFATEDQGQNNNGGESTSTENTSTTETTSLSSETNTSTSEASTSSDETIFDAILQGEQTLVNPSSEPTPLPIEPPPAE